MNVWTRKCLHQRLPLFGTPHGAMPTGSRWQPQILLFPCHRWTRRKAGQFVSMCEKRRETIAYLQRLWNSTKTNRRYWILKRYDHLGSRHDTGQGAGCVHSHFVYFTLKMAGRWPSLNWHRKGLSLLWEGQIANKALELLISWSYRRAERGQGAEQLSICLGGLFTKAKVTHS